MPIVDYWKKVVLENYAQFEGRARRSEYWWFVLANFCIAFVLYLLGEAMSLFTVVAALYSLAVLIPGIAVAIRRLHDTGKSGWMLLIGLVPFVGAIILIVFMATDSQRGTNQYGPSEKYPNG